MIMAWVRYLFLAIMLCFASHQAVAQQPDFDVRRVGLIDLNYVLRSAQATTTIRKLLDEKRNEFSAEFQEVETDLLQRERELNLKRSILSETDFNEALQAFQEEVAQVQKEIQFKRNSLDQAFQQAQENLRKITMEIVTGIATREQLDMVVNRDTALIFRPALNITEEVLFTLNEKTKNARIEVGELPF